MSAIQKDAESNDTALTAESASDIFLKQWEAAAKPADDVEGESDDSDSIDTDYITDDEEPNLEDDEGTEDPEDSDEDAPKKYIEDEDALVKVVVDGQEITASLKDLKRLAGQEASLTRKSMELAARRKEAEEVGTYHAQGLARLVQMAEEEYAPYANIDFNIAAKDLSTEEYQALREEAMSKYQKYQFLTSELTQYQQKFGAQQARMMQEQAAQTISELSDPEKGIKGWGPKLYEEIGEYAVSKGMQPETFARILDAPSLRILYDAYRLEKAKAMATKKKAAAPKKVLKSTATPDSQRFSEDKSKAQLSKLRQTGSRDDAVSAILARWGQG